MTPSPEAHVIRWDPSGGPPRRLVFEPIGNDWERIESVWSGCGYWRVVGREIVHNVTFGRPAVTSQTGP